ncbi:hypothetical protein [Serratia marcescens]|uniref:hypothetical protein n=1 Tax=Serratia marcescens TaxID=615 RepID=UPI0013DD59E7|nr:hypothetical protein [Serratia marcescens]
MPFHRVSILYPLSWIVCLGGGAAQLAVGVRGQLFFLNWYSWLGFCVFAALMALLWGVARWSLNSSRSNFIAGLASLVMWGLITLGWLFLMASQGAYLSPTVEMLVGLSAFTVCVASLFFLGALFFEGCEL